MCDPISIGLGVLGGAQLYGAHESRKDAKAAAAESRAQMAAAASERTRVETEAIQAAQADVARTKGRRRQTLLGSAASLTAPSAQAAPVPSMLSRGATFMGG